MTEIKPGDHIVCDASLFREGYSVCRVIKPAPLGNMWEVEFIKFDMMNDDMKVSEKVRRKIKIAHRIPDGSDILNVVRETFKQCETFWAAERHLAKMHRRFIAAFAEGQEPEYDSLEDHEKEAFKLLVESAPTVRAYPTKT